MVEPTLSDDGTTALIPLRARDGSIRAYTLIDSNDATFVNQWRWSLNKGYAARGAIVDGKSVSFRLHRELLGLIYGDGLEGDHRDLNRLNNRRGNLRLTTRPQNAQNRTSWPGVTSRHRGVCWKKREQKWVATICVNRKYTHLGYFTSETEAAEVASAARKRLMTHATE